MKITMEKDARIYVAGHRGMVGSSIVEQLKRDGYTNVITVGKDKCNLMFPEDVRELICINDVEYVFLCAARVGGIKANMEHPAELLYENLQIQNNVFEACRHNGVEKLMFLGSSCIYPRDCPQPMKEEYLMTGPLEPTNEGYALAKISGIRMAQYYRKQYGLNTICPIPCNLYGDNDHFDPDRSHVMAALIKKFVDAAEKETPTVALWGTGEARREFMHVEDFSRAAVFLMNNYDSPDIINIGSGKDVPIDILAMVIAGMSGYEGGIEWDRSMPDGMPQKLLDVDKMSRLGFEPKINLVRGIHRMIRDYREHGGST